MRALHLGDRRFLAVAVFGLVSLLEICGCNPSQRGDETGVGGVASVAWTAVLDRCPSCSSDLTTENHPRDQKPRVELGMSLSFPQTGPPLTALLGKDVPSFYDPVSSAQTDDIRDEPALRSVLSVDDKPGPWTIPESVFFVYKTILASDGRVRRIPSATAFVVSVPDVAHKTTIRLLVTARHVVDPEWAHCAEKNPQSIDVRFNRWSGGVGYETIRLQNNHVPDFVAPSDGTADLAVIQLDEHLVPNLESYKFFDTPFRLLPTDSELRMVQSDQQIMTAGLLTRPSAERSNYPVSHGGILSGNSMEAVTMQCGATPASTQLHVWFINAAIPQGVSGAPVFTSMRRGEGGNKTPVLLGVQAVAWPERGIAGMTPSTVLNDLIHQALRKTKLPMDFSKGANP